jgi:hypothetical protein
LIIIALGLFFIFFIYRELKALNGGSSMLSFFRRGNQDAENPELFED